MDVVVTTGLALVVELNPCAGVQLYELPPLAFIETVEPVHKFKSGPAFAIGGAVTDMVTASVFEQPLLVTITV